MRGSSAGSSTGSAPMASEAESRVKVAVRVRPLLPREVLRESQECVHVVITEPDQPPSVVVGNDRAFDCDFVFGPEVQQDEVYATCVQPLVSAVMDGYNATVFAYGQTGSGKTYTIGGGPTVSTAEGQCGIIPRAVEEIFQRMEQMPDTAFAVRTTYVEVYKEELRDLLELGTPSKILHIREDERGNTVLIGAREQEVESGEELLTLLEAGNAARRTGSNQLNEHSSRSHALLTIILKQRRLDSPRCVFSKFHLVDLAGSERLARVTSAPGSARHFQESVQINSGLLALGNVIRALADPRRRAQHIPYRDAKITRLLRDSLGGNSRTLLIACVSPAPACLQESLSSLLFASRARDVRNRPVVNWEAWGRERERERVGALEEELRTLKEALKERAAEGVGAECDQSRLRALQEQLTQVRRRSLQYRALTQEAANLLLLQAQNSTHDPAHSLRLQEWLETQEELESEVSAPKGQGCSGGVESEGESQHCNILQLRRELNRCQEALVADEEVFAEREQQVRQLQQEVSSLQEQCRAHMEDLQEERNRNRLQSERLVEQQLVMERLRDLQTSSSCPSSCRPYSVPLTSHLHDSNHGNVTVRKVHTSPPAYSLDRVMACFKMRSQLLQAQVEVQDGVFLQACEEEEGSADEEHVEEEEEEGPSKAFRRSLNLTWTRRGRDHASFTPAGRGLGLRPHLPQPNKHHAGVSVSVEMASGSGDVCRYESATAELRSLRSSQASNLQLLKEAELCHSHTYQRIKELTLNIRLKENLIRELRKTGNDAQVNNTSSKQNSRQEKSRVQGDRRALQSLCLHSERVRVEQEHSVEQMKRESERLKRALEEEESRKRRIQEDLNHDLRRIRELESEAQLQRREQQHSSTEAKTLEEQRRWLEQQEERVLQQRRGLQELEEELRCREEMLTCREELSQERSHIQLKKLRSSQALGRDLLGVSARLSAVDRELEQEGGAALERLREEREQLCRRRDALDDRLRDGSVLTAEEEHALLQLEEAIEALDVAVQYRSLSIDGRQRASALTPPPSEGDMMDRLSALPPPHIKALLIKYFDRVVCMREEERRLRLCCEEQQLQLQEQQGVVRELEAALQRLTLAADRRLMEQQREHQHTLQLLLHELTGEAGAGVVEWAEQREGRVQALEKELYFYKSTSRQLRRKLRELAPSVCTESAASSLTDAPSQDTPPNSAHDRRRLAEEAGRGRDSRRAESAPVRVSHRQVRQISPPPPHPRRSSDSSFQQDSIEVSRRDQ
ncbi:hypothetical protein AGOR_G00046640 [Albula goreensis]|uniref:Kinesin motor domain-containing protein n=1 Tax=Albula goreensis TaxID=1534307 RepID=A0A8T3DRN7_9TELE|nr:hypothetical protein AGOR_G00046640 [Albula goreensis]